MTTSPTVRSPPFTTPRIQSRGHSPRTFGTARSNRTGYPTRSSVRLAPTVRGGVLDAPRLRDRRAALDAAARRGRLRTRLPRRARLCPPPNAYNSAGTARAPFHTGVRSCPLTKAGRAWKPAPTACGESIRSSPTLHQPLSHGAKRRDSSPFRGAEGGCGAITLSVITRRAGVEARPYGRHPELTRAALLLLAQIAPCYFGQNVLI